MPNIAKLMKQAADMQRNFSSAREELAAKELSFSAGGGAVEGDGFALDEHLDALFDFVELRRAGLDQFLALLEGFDHVFQAELAAFHLVGDGLQAFQRSLESEAKQELSVIREAAHAVIGPFLVFLEDDLILSVFNEVCQHGEGYVSVQPKLIEQGHVPSLLLIHHSEAEAAAAVRELAADGFLRVADIRSKFKAPGAGVHESLFRHEIGVLYAKRDLISGETQRQEIGHGDLYAFALEHILIRSHDRELGRDEGQDDIDMFLLADVDDSRDIIVLRDPRNHITCVHVLTKQRSIFTVDADDVDRLIVIVFSQNPDEIIRVHGASGNQYAYHIFSSSPSAESAVKRRVTVTVGFVILEVSMPVRSTDLKSRVTPTLCTSNVYESGL